MQVRKWEAYARVWEIDFAQHEGKGRGQAANLVTSGEGRGGDLGTWRRAAAAVSPSRREERDL